jgi:hypothetical protein
MLSAFHECRVLAGNFLCGGPFGDTSKSHSKAFARPLLPPDRPLPQLRNAIMSRLVAPIILAYLAISLHAQESAKPKLYLDPINVNHGIRQQPQCLSGAEAPIPSIAVIRDG